MFKGVEDVKKAITLCREVVKGLKNLATNSESEEFIGRLQEVVSQLESTQNKFFLKTNLSVRFTSSCFKRAGKLKETLASIVGPSSENVDWNRFTSDIQELNKNVRLLVEKSDTGGDIVIT